MPPSRSLPHLLAAVALTGCASAAPVHDRTVGLAPRQTVRLASDVRLTYDSVSDSRCPPDVACIWAGRLAFHLIVDGPNGREEITLSREQPAATPRALHGARIALDLAAIPPARGADSAASANLIPVTLRVTSQ